MIHAQSFSGFTSHLPFFAPPQGPFTRDLAHLVTGQIAPVWPSTQSPHMRHISLKWPTRSTWPMNMVLLPG